jgi:RNA polymerase sigma-70 factor, ECF subfamily
MFDDDLQSECSMCGEGPTPAMLVDRYGDDVYSIARSMCATSDDAAEVTANTFASAVKGIAFRPLVGDLRTWLCGTAVEIALERRPFIAHSAKDWLQRLEKRSSEPVVESDGLTTALHEGLEALDGRVRAAFVLYDLAALSIEDTARILRTSHREARARVHQARLSLHQVLDDYFRARAG